MLLLDLDRKSCVPLHRQLVKTIRERIDSGALQPGEKLPSTRQLAVSLGTHRTTVASAYQQLWSLGYLDLRQRARPRVRRRTAVVSPADHQQQWRLDWGKVASPATEGILRDHREFPPPAGGPVDESTINLATLDMDQRLFPLDQFRSCLNRASIRGGSELLTCGDPAGYLPLREYLARRLRQHGIQVAAGELLLTNGSQQGIDLLFRLLAAPGRAIAFEAPTYDYMLPLLRFYGMKPLAIPLRDDGMDLDFLERTLRHHRPSAIYTMPSFQNPTGISTTQAHRERLLVLCEEHQTLLVEDGYDEEMQYSGKVVLAVKSMDWHGLVAYCGTFSKVLFPGARVGWIAADRDGIERLLAIRRFAEIAPSSLMQAAISRFCRAGYFDRHVSKMHRTYRSRMQVALQVLHEHIPPDLATWTEPRGGFLIWLRLQAETAPAQELPRLLAKNGVRVGQGRFFFSGPEPQTCLRLSIASLNEQEIDEGVRRLRRVLEEYVIRIRNTPCRGEAA
ncbi:MAG: PLP-dependent aminotransferase family protein [bacterium]